MLRTNSVCVYPRFKIPVRSSERLFPRSLAPQRVDKTQYSERKQISRTKPTFQDFRSEFKPVFQKAFWYFLVKCRCSAAHANYRIQFSFMQSIPTLYPYAPPKCCLYLSKKNRVRVYAKSWLALTCQPAKHWFCGITFPLFSFSLTHFLLPPEYSAFRPHNQIYLISLQVK